MHTCRLLASFQAGDWVAQYVTLEDVLRAAGMPLILFAATVAVTCRTDWGPGIGGIDLDAACEAVRESGLVKQALDYTTLDKVGPCNITGLCFLLPTTAYNAGGAHACVTVAMHRRYMI